MKNLIIYLLVLSFYSGQGKVEKKIIEEPNMVTSQAHEEIGLINDPDGYTNARKEPSSSSDILLKIVEGEYFFYNSIKHSNWSEIKTLEGQIAYIHNSRIKKINQNNVIVFLSEYYDNNEERDKLKKNILAIKSLDDSEAFSIKEFSYPKLNIKRKSNDTIILLSDDKNKSVEIISGLFEKEKHYIEFDEDDYINKIDSKKIYGNDKIPIREIKLIRIKNNLMKFDVDKKVFSNLYEPNLEHVKVYSKGDNQLIISMTNGYGAVNSYKSILIFDNSNLLKHVTYIPF